MAFDLKTAIHDRIAEGGASPALMHQGEWRSWAWLHDAARALDAAIGDSPIVGLVARPRPWHVAAMAADVMAGRATAMIYCAQTTTGIAADIEKLRLPAVVADRQDWDDRSIAAARAVGTIAIATSEDRRDGIEVLTPAGDGVVRDIPADLAFQLLSSGTTGAPKRLALSWNTTNTLVEDARLAYVGSASSDVPQVMSAPLGNVSGLAYVLPPLAYGTRLVMLERFDPILWAQAVRDYRPARGAMTPTGVRMLLDTDVPAEWLSSLKVVGIGGGALDPAVQQAFEERFGMPILPAFGATEFGGVIANWTLDAHARYGATKRGSCGQASRGVELRIVDADSGAVLSSGERGLLQAKVDRIGPDWITTTDLATLDDDGFLFVHGRSDGAINRGGFKVLPDIVANVIKQHPAVGDAAVIGRPDARLGEVPVAAIELRAGRDLGADDLRAWLKDRLLAYQVPAELRFIDALPRNASLKVSLPEVRALFA